jgi:hypothetical protein
MYLEKGDNKRKSLGFQDFFPMDRIALEQNGLDIISMDTFLSLQEDLGLRDRHGRISSPPRNRTNWNGMNQEIVQELQPWLRRVSVQPRWNPDECLAAFPSSTTSNPGVDLQATWDGVIHAGGFRNAETYIGHPTAVNASVVERLGEAKADRTALCIYNKTLRNEPLLHFSGKKWLGGRLLTHFYSFLFFQDWRQDLWTKRFVRDHLRYNDDLQCAAARIVEAIRERARKRDPSNIDGLFDAFHVRRGEFQYKSTRVSSLEMYNGKRE